MLTQGFIFRPLQGSNIQNYGFCKCGEMKKSLTVLLLERMQENLLVAGLEEYAEGIYGVLKMKRDHIPEEVLAHIIKKISRISPVAWERRRSRTAQGSWQEKGWSSRSGH